MCGIAGTIGILASREADPLARALSALAPRGPDGGRRVDDLFGGRPLHLGVRRLALVDPGGNQQPVTRPSGAMLVFNGEIYNHEALRRRMVGQGERFRSAGDAEVLCALLDREGMDGLARVEGSFAFAFREGNEGALWLGRDAAGVRPLVYARVGTGFAFASTIDALRAMGFLTVTPNLGAIVEVLRDGVVSGTHTALSEVVRVAPGELIRIDTGLHMSRREVPTALRPEEEEDGNVLDALRAAVWDRLRLDRPAGVFLSGGIDSALIAALAAEAGRVTAFTLTFPGHRAADESERSRRTARRLSLRHVIVPCPADPTAWVLGTARAFDEPFADASAVPTWGLARAAGREVRAVLSGTGGDELFGGYRRYWLVGAGPWLRHVPGFIREPVARVLERNAPASARLLHASADPQGLYRGLLRLQPVPELRAVLGPALSGVAEPEPRRGPRTPREAMGDDLARYLPDDLLVKEDRALMAHGVEGRHPFLDHRVRRAAARVEVTGQPGRAQQKRILRAYVQESVDPDLARVAKHGFAFPVDTLYRGPLRPLAQDALLGKAARERGFVAPSGARRLLKDHVSGARQVGQTLHALVMLELWARRVLDR